MTRPTDTLSRAWAAVSWLALAMLTAFFAWSSLPLAWIASENGRILTAFQTDEFYHLHMLEEALQARTFHFGINAYGHLFFDLALLPLWMLHGPVSDHTIILTLRLVSWTFAAATVAMLFVATRRMCGLVSAVVVSALLVLTPVFMRWSVISHPDMVQLFFLTACLYAIARRLDRGAWHWTIVAAVMAGLAFASKYAGLFILPVVWGAELASPIVGPRVPDRAISSIRAAAAALAVAMVAAGLVLSPAFVAAHLTIDGSIAPELADRAVRLVQQLRLLLGGIGIVLGALVWYPGCWRSIERSDRLRWTIVMIVATAAVFFAVFTVVSPDSWRGFAFAKGLIAEASFPEINDHGGPTEWVGVLVGPYVLTPLLFVFLVAGAMSALRHMKDGTRLAFEKVCLAWVLIFGAVVVAGVQERPARYLLPLLPAFLVLAVAGARSVLAWAAVRGPMVRRAAVVLLAGSLVFELGQDAVRTLRLRDRIQHEMEDSAAVQVAEMLECRVAPGAAILFDYFSYVPPAFPHAEPTWGATLDLLQRTTPDVVITTQQIEHLYQPASVQYAYYQALRHDHVPYRLAASVGDVSVYVRRGSPNVMANGDGSDTTPWTPCR